jgi:two-component system CheB/CheR fusion protein
VRILPYRTTENIIDGLAINFININKLKVAELYAHQAYLMTAIVNTVPQPMLVLDHKLCISLVNPAYLKNYGLNHDDFIGQSLFSIHNSAFNTAALRDLLNHTISHNQAFTDFKIDVLLPLTGIKSLLLTGCTLKLSPDIPPHILLSINERPSS